MKFRTPFDQAIILSAGLCIAAVADEAPAIPDQLDARLADAIGRSVAVTTTFEREIGAWRLTCGEPVETSGEALDIATTTLAESEFGARFCALLRRDAGGGAEPDGDAGEQEATNADPWQVIEFDIGSNDMPAMDWIPEHDLPADLLQTP